MGAESTELAALEKALRDSHTEIKNLVAKAEGEINEVGKTSAETKAAIAKYVEDANKVCDRLDKLEAKMNRKGELDSEIETVGAQFVKSEAFKAMAANNGKQARMQFKNIVNATGQNQPLVPSDRMVGLIAQPNRRLTIRDLLMVGRTNSNLIEYTKENVFTNNAGPQYEASPQSSEGAKKPQSGITFTLANAAVVTIAHYIKASKQVLADSPQLESYINGRLIYGLKLEEEDEILNGTGSAGSLDGILNQSTAYNRGATNDSKIDILRKSMTQAQLSEYSVSGFVLNPADWEDIELQKDTQGRYIYGDPATLQGPSIWGRPVVATNAIAEGTFLSGAFDLGAQLWDREDAAVQAGFENDDFTRNLVTLLCEERIALTVFRTQAFIKGTW